MTLPLKPNSKPFWHHHVNQWNDSDISQAAYCREHKLSIKRFGYWKRKLLGSSPTGNATQNNGFVQVIAETETSIHPTTLVIELPNQLRIEGVTSEHLPLVKQLAELL